MKWINAFLIFLIGFSINFIWEVAHSPLYTCYINFTNHFPLVIRATLGDALYILAVYFILGFLKKDFNFYKATNYKDVLVIILVGLVVATIIELLALNSGRWAYLPSMPIVPLLNIGLTPFIQLATTSIMTLTFYSYLSKKYKLI